MNRFIYYKTLQFLVTEQPDSKWVNLPSPLKLVHLNRSELLVFAENAENELDQAFVNSAISKGDDCYGILDGGTLANYGWYSRMPTLIDNDGLLLEFDPRYIYMYKGFTLDRYRGQRLHAINKTRALCEYTAWAAKECCLTSKPAISTRLSPVIEWGPGLAGGSALFDLQADTLFARIQNATGTD